MTIYHGVSIYEFFWQDSPDPGKKCGELCEFANRLGALSWLEVVGGRYLELIPELRRLLARWDASIHRLTDPQVLDVAALLLYSGRVRVRYREVVDLAGSSAAPPPVAVSQPFALADRRPRPAPQPTRPPAADASVFSPDVDFSAQAAALVAAATSGAPFCPE